MAIFNRNLIILCVYRKSSLFERIIFPVNLGQICNNTLLKLYYVILFTEDGAYYHGNNSGNNTLKVNTIKGKAAKGVAGEAVAVSLADSTAPAETNELYVNIQTVDASASANEVELTAVAVSEYGTKFLKAHAGVDVTAAAGAGTDNVGTTFTGSAFNDRFT